MTINGMNLNFRYKGERNYVHGTDMYAAIVDSIKKDDLETTVQNFRMVIHGLVKHQCRLICSDNPAKTSHSSKPKVEFRFTLEKSPIVGRLVETSDAVTERYQYREEDIVDECSINKTSMIYRGQTPYSAIEVLVAITKHLHLSLFPQVDGKWYFTRIDLDRLLQPEDTSCFRLNLIQNLQFRLTKTQILSGDQEIGHIYFSLVKQS